MRSYIIDLDGTLYRGGEAVEYAAEFIDYLNKNKRKYLLATNCPLNSAADTVKKLADMGIYVKEENVLNCAMVCAEYLHLSFNKKPVLAIGSQAFKSCLLNNNIALCNKNVSAVAVGFEKTLDYNEISTACEEIRKGAKFIVTNLDNVIPSGDGFIPHTGALATYISCATGISPINVGKPSKFMMQAALNILQCAPENCCVIGDRLDTDMLFAQTNNTGGFLMLTGFTTKSMLNDENSKNIKVFVNLHDVMLYEQAEKIN